MAALWAWLAFRPRPAPGGPLRPRSGWVEATFDSVRGPGGGEVVLEVWDGERGLARSRPAALPEAPFGMGPVVMPPDGEVQATLTRDGTELCRWTVQSGTGRFTAPLEGGGEAVLGVSFRRQGGGEAGQATFSYQERLRETLAQPEAAADLARRIGATGGLREDEVVAGARETLAMVAADAEGARAFLMAVRGARGRWTHRPFEGGQPWFALPGSGPARAAEDDNGRFQAWLDWLAAHGL